MTGASRANRGTAVPLRSLTHLLHAALVVALATMAAGNVHAQLKPSRGSEPLSLPAAPAPRPELTDKESAAVKAAAEWLKLVDAREYGKSWDACAPLFREKVSRQTWVENLPRSRAKHGAFKSRTLSAAASRTSMPGAPEGDYVAVRFLTDFDKASGVEEVVTMTFVGGAWRPIGYLLQ